MSQPRYLCAVCRSKLPKLPERHLNIGRHFQLLVATAAIALCVYFLAGEWAAVKSLFVYLPLWLGAEWIQWLRLRDALRCRVCHFDPMLYRTNWKAARRLVEKRLQEHSLQLQGRIRAEIERLAQQKTGASPQAADKAPAQAEEKPIGASPTVKLPSELDPEEIKATAAARAPEESP